MKKILLIEVSPRGKDSDEPVGCRSRLCRAGDRWPSRGCIHHFAEPTACRCSSPASASSGRTGNIALSRPGVSGVARGIGGDTIELL